MCYFSIFCPVSRKDIWVHNAKAIKGTIVPGAAKERKSTAERFSHPPTLEPTRSPAAKSRGVSRVKGFKRRVSAIWVVPRISPSHGGW